MKKFTRLMATALESATLIGLALLVDSVNWDQPGLLQDLLRGAAFVISVCVVWYVVRMMAQSALNERCLIDVYGSLALGAIYLLVLYLFPSFNIAMAALGIIVFFGDRIQGRMMRRQPVGHRNH